MNILFVVPYVPTPIRTRPYHLARALARRGHALTLATLWEGPAERQALDEFERAGMRVLAEPLERRRILGNLVQVLPGRRPLQARYSWHPGLARRMLAAVQAGQFDAIHVEHLRAAEYGLFLKAQANGRTPGIVWDSVDCISLLFEQAVRHSQSRFGRWATRFDLPRTRRYEAWLLGQFQRVLVTSQADRLALEGLARPAACEASPAPIVVLPNGVDGDHFNPTSTDADASVDVGLRKNQAVIFTGKMSYHANITAARHLVENIMPRVWAHKPGVPVWVVGKDPAASLLELARDEPRLHVQGHAPDLAPYIRQAAVSAAPIVYGAGIQNKVLEAMACGTPVVASPQAAQALQAVDGQDLLVAADPAAFAAAILRLLDDPALRQRLGQNGRRYVLRCHDWDAAAGQLEAIYGEVNHGHCG
ncbi:MAG TPA: glycosyltransferase [Anaerolineales bacterium]|nr:glycosyltransferase [Anaerolineales bacterium]